MKPSQGLWHAIASVTLIWIAIGNIVFCILLGDAYGWRFGIGAGLVSSGFAIGVSLMSVVYAAKTHAMIKQLEALRDHIHETFSEAVTAQSRELVKRMFADMQRRGLIPADATLNFEIVEDDDERPDGKLN